MTLDRCENVNIKDQKLTETVTYKTQNFAGYPWVYVFRVIKDLQKSFLKVFSLLEISFMQAVLFPCIISPRYYSSIF